MHHPHQELEAWPLPVSRIKTVQFSLSEVLDKAASGFCFHA